MNQKKIALVIYSLHEGGAEKVASELSIHFSQSGHHVSVIVFDDRHRVYAHGGRLVDLNLPAAEHASPIISMLSRAKLLVARAWRLRRLNQRQSFDLMIAVMESAGFAAVLASRDAIVANHCNPEENFSRMEWWLADYLFPRARKVVTVSEQGAALFKQRLPLKNLQCIYNPISQQRIRQAAAKPTEIPVLSQRYIIAIGRLEQVKRFDRLLEAYAHSKVCDEVDLVILGQGSLYETLKQKVAELGLSRQVIMPGYVDNPFPYIKQALFTVLSSDHEGFPMVLIESLCLGKPVIATNCPTGPDEIIRDGQNGLLVPVKDVGALASAIYRLVVDKKMYQSLAANAVESVRHLSIETIAQQWLALCKPVVKA